jgi:uncharacterized membrane protein YfcA
MLEILGYVGAIVIGLTLGLIGGGGSILTVPVLVYLSGVTAVTATAYSLFIVGFSSLVGSVTYMRKGLVSFKTALIFGVPSIIAVYITRRYIVPAIPDEVFTLGSLLVTKDILLMLIFAVLMIFASYSMIKGRKETEQEEVEQKFNYPMIILEGAVVGLLTGLVGAGGGFLIIPALVILSKLPMKMAIGTSLLIISIKSLIGFTGDLATREVDWAFLAIFSALAVAGIFLGSYLSNFIPGKKLKPAFGWFVLIMGVYILTKELFF